LARRLREGTLRAGDINRFVDIAEGEGQTSASSRARRRADFHRRRMTISIGRSILTSC
jgi:hypothetical protein